MNPASKLKCWVCMNHCTFEGDVIVSNMPNFHPQILEDAWTMQILLATRKVHMTPLVNVFNLITITMNMIIIYNHSIQHVYTYCKPDPKSTNHKHVRGLFGIPHDQTEASDGLLVPKNEWPVWCQQSTPTFMQLFEDFDCGSCHQRPLA